LNKVKGSLERLLRKQKGWEYVAIKNRKTRDGQRFKKWAKWKLTDKDSSLENRWD